MERLETVRLDALNQLDASSLPSEFRLFQFGDNPSKKGTFKLDAEGADSILSAYKQHGAELPIDYEHQTFESAKNGQPAPAAGWFVPEARADGIWATNVRWTPRAVEMLRNREYRYFSPTFNVDKDNRITRLLPLALTNAPASRGQQALIAAAERPVDGVPVNKKTAPKEFEMNTLTTILGLKDDAEEAQTLERVHQLANAERQLLDITGKESVGEALALVIAAKESASQLEKARAELLKWEETAARDEADKKEKLIAAKIRGAILDRRVSEKDIDTIEKLKRLGSIGVEHMESAISMLRAQPVRQFAPPVPTNPEQAIDAAIDRYMQSNPKATRGEAYIALASTGKLGGTSGVAVEE